MVRVLNKRTDPIPVDAVYVGRPTKWGNPFRTSDPLMPSRLPRAEKHRLVVEEYRKWIQTQPELLEALTGLAAKDLVCWCSPLPCHADVLLEMAVNESTNESEIETKEEGG